MNKTFEIADLPGEHCSPELFVLEIPMLRRALERVDRSFSRVENWWQLLTIMVNKGKEGAKA